MQRSERPYAAAGVLMLAAVVTLSINATLGMAGHGRLLIGALVACAALAYAPAIEWRWLLACLILVILFIPIRVYSVRANLPFAVEPYRALVAALLVAWLGSLLVDARIRLRRTGFEGPLALIVFAAVASVVANSDRVSSLQADVVKSLTFFASFVLVFYLVASVGRGLGTAGFLARIFVLGGSVVAGFAILESRTGFNPFNHLGRVLPFLTLNGAGLLDRGGQFRAFGSAEHPIALSAALIMLVPLAAYLARTVSRYWWLCALMLTLGALATRSRTGVVMLIAVALVFLWLRPAETRRMWPLIIPVLAVIHFTMPGTLGTFKASFFPQEGLISQQESSAGSCSSAGRVADLRPSLTEAARKPVFGTGYGTRVVTGENANACILDDQWLGTLLEGGAVAVLAWVWLFTRFLRRMRVAARVDHSARGWLIVAVAASVAAYAVGMLTFDAFSFVQVTFFLYIFLGLGAALLSEGEDVRVPVPAR